MVGCIIDIRIVILVLGLKNETPNRSIHARPPRGGYDL